MNRLRGWLQIGPDESRVVWLVVGITFAMSFGNAVGGNAVEGTVFPRFGTRYLPQLCIGLGMLNFCPDARSPIEPRVSFSERHEKAVQLFTKQLLCQFSYAGVFRRVTEHFLDGGWRANTRSYGAPRDQGKNGEAAAHVPAGALP